MNGRFAVRTRATGDAVIFDAESKENVAVLELKDNSYPQFRTLKSGIVFTVEDAREIYRSILRLSHEEFCKLAKEEGISDW